MGDDGKRYVFAADDVEDVMREAFPTVRAVRRVVCTCSSCNGADGLVVGGVDKDPRDGRPAVVFASTKSIRPTIQLIVLTSEDDLLLAANLLLSAGDGNANNTAGAAALFAAWREVQCSPTN